MKGDFTRFRHDPDDHYSGVLKQQGRVDLDSDWNEHVAIRAYRERTEAEDVIGCCGVPRAEGGFEILPGLEPEEGEGSPERVGADEKGDTLLLSPGRIYVDGLLCENPPAEEGPRARPLTEQPYLPAEELSEIVDDGGLGPGRYTAYLDVWQRHVTALEDESLREVALGGPDTTTRTQTVWQVRLEPHADTREAADLDEDALCPPCDWNAREEEPRLKAWADPTEEDEELCEIPESGGFRGIENRLYRVEVHESGRAGDATFKWSRDNGAVVYPIESVGGNVSDPADRMLTLAEQPRDHTLALGPGDTVEITWEEKELEGEPGLMAKVTEKEGGKGDETRVPVAKLDGKEIPDPGDVTDLKVRRWEHSTDPDGPAVDGALPVREAEPLELEQGVYVEFEEGSRYETGDYWTIPARAGKEDVLWPVEDGGELGGERGTALFQSREGIERHTCALALVEVERVTETEDDTGLRLHRVRDCRDTFPGLTEVGKTCCRVVEPEDDLRQAIHEVMEAGGGCVSLCRGVHEVDAPLELDGAHDLVLHGVGEATVLRLVRQETGGEGAEERGNGRGPAGLVLRDCRNVSVENMLVVGEGVDSVVATRPRRGPGDGDARESGHGNRGLGFEDLTVLHEGLLGTMPGGGGFRSALSVADASGVRVEESRLLAPVGVLGRFGHRLPEVPGTEASERPEGEGEEHRITFEEIEPEDREAFEIGETFRSGGAEVAVSTPEFGDFGRGSARPGTVQGHAGLMWNNARLDLQLERDFGGTADELRVRVIDMGGKSELRVNGHSRVADRNVENLAGTIDDVEVEIRPDPEIEHDRAFVLELAGEVRTLGVGGQELIVHHLYARTRPFGVPPQRKPIDYGDGVRDLRISNSTIRFSLFGVFSCRSEGWVLEDTAIERAASDALLADDRHDDEPAVPSSLHRRVGRIVRTEPEELHSTTAVKAFLWRDGRIEDCRLTAARGMDTWWQIRGRIEGTRLRTSARGLHAFWLHDATWRENRIERTAGVAASFWGSFRARLRENRAKAASGLVNASLLDAAGDLLRWLQVVRAAYGGEADGRPWRRTLWILLEDTVRLAGLEEVVGWVEEKAREIYRQSGPIDGTGGLHERAVFRPLLYVAADELLDRLTGEDEGQPEAELPQLDLTGEAREHLARRVSPTIGLEMEDNRIEADRDAVLLRGIVPVGGLEIAENELHAGLGGEAGQALRVDAAPVAANVHLNAMFWNAAAEGLEDSTEGSGGSTEGTGDTAEEADVEADQTGAVRGQVTSSDGDPLQGAQVMVDGTERGTLTDARGQYRLTEVPAGRRTIRVRLTGHAPSSRKVQVEPNQSVTADFVLEQPEMETDSIPLDFPRGVRAASDYLIRENTLFSLNTAIESNLFDLDVVGNHVTLDRRPETAEEISGARGVLQGHPKLVAADTMMAEGSVTRLRKTRVQAEKRAMGGMVSEASAFERGGTATDSDATVDQQVGKLVDRYPGDSDEFDEAEAAETVAELMMLLERVTNSYGVWIKSPGCRVTRNHVLVPPEIDETRAPRGGVRLEAPRTHWLVAALALAAGTDPLLGVTETAISSNEIIGGLAWGVDVHGLIMRSGRRKEYPAGVTAPLSGEAVESFPAEGRSALPALPGVADLEIRENEIRGLERGAVLVRERTPAVDVSITDNAVSGCATGATWLATDATRVTARPSGGQGAEIVGGGRTVHSVRGGSGGGIVVLGAGLCRITGNEVVDSALSDGAFGIHARTVVQLTVDANTVVGCGSAARPTKYRKRGGGIGVVDARGQTSVQQNELLGNRPWSLYLDNSERAGTAEAALLQRLTARRGAGPIDAAGQDQARVSGNRIRAPGGSGPRPAPLVGIGAVDQLLFSDNAVQGDVSATNVSEYPLCRIGVGERLTVSDNLFHTDGETPEGTTTLGLLIFRVPGAGQIETAGPRTVIVLGNNGSRQAGIVVESDERMVEHGFNLPAVVFRQP